MSGKNFYMENIDLRLLATFTFLESGLETHGETNSNPAESEASRLLGVLTSMVQKSHISTLFNMAQLAYTQNLKV